MKKVIVEKSGGIIHARINRPEDLNACDGETHNAIAGTLSPAQVKLEGMPADDGIQDRV